MDGEVEDGSQARPVSSPEDYHRSSSETLLPPTTRYVKRCRNRARQPAMLLASPFEVSFLDSSEDCRSLPRLTSPPHKDLKYPVLEHRLNDFNAKEWTKVVRKNNGMRGCRSHRPINDVLLHAVIVDLMHSKFVGCLGNMPEGRYMVFFGKISACRQVSGY
jgi:hypothetical protein